MFKTQQDIWEHLLVEGNKIHNPGIYSTVWLEKGFLVDKDGRRYYSFDKPSDWEPYIEPAWEDKLDGTEENAVWCCVSDITKEPWIAATRKFTLAKVLDYRPSEDFSYAAESKLYWRYAKPLTEEDKQTLFPS